MRIFDFQTCARYFLGLASRSASKKATHIFTHDNVAEILKLQPKTSFAKPYQVKQARKVVVQYQLAKGDL